MSLVVTLTHLTLTNTMNTNLEMLSAREQLMEDIDAIVEEHSYYSNMSADKAEELIRVLCDAVCKNFPSN